MASRTRNDSSSTRFPLHRPRLRSLLDPCGNHKQSTKGIPASNSLRRTLERPLLISKCLEQSAPTDWLIWPWLTGRVVTTDSARTPVVSAALNIDVQPVSATGHSAEPSCHGSVARKKMRPSLPFATYASPARYAVHHQLRPRPCICWHSAR